LARTLVLATALAMAGAALANDPKATIADLDARLAKIGAPKINGTEVVAGKTVPAIFFGDRKINNNCDVFDAGPCGCPPTCSRPRASAASARHWPATPPTPR
jgi:hypothetical protein